jgi:hypothetical protein
MLLAPASRLCARYHLGGAHHRWVADVLVAKHVPTLRVVIALVKVSRSATNFNLSPTRTKILK